MGQSRGVTVPADEDLVVAVCVDVVPVDFVADMGMEWSAPAPSASREGPG